MRSVLNENGLSEVIGFILIIIVIITASSIYLTYAVPAQGRENEILHMNEVRDEFVSYKLGVDALWTNNQVGTAMSTSFNLGTQGGATQGAISFIPIMSPVPSGGTLALNQRQEVLTVQSKGLIRDGKVISNQSLVPGSLPLNATPTVFWVNISDTSIPATPAQYAAAQKRSVFVQEGQNWSVNVTVNPKINYYYPNSTDITIDVTKTGLKTLQGFTVYQNIQSNTRYAVNLLDDAYGLKNFLAGRPYPMTVTLTRYDSVIPTLTGSGNVSLIDEYENVATHSLALGALEYTASNNYWIPQTYYYQNGGVFLQQDNSTYKLPPAITFSYDQGTRVIGVKIIELPFQQSNSGNLGGNSPAQVRTQVASIQTLPYSLTYNNTKWINLSITSNDSRAVAVWYRYFTDTINITAGVPNNTPYPYYFSGLSNTQAFLRINGTGTSENQYDVHVEGLQATLSASVQGG